MVNYKSRVGKAVSTSLVWITALIGAEGYNPSHAGPGACPETGIYLQQETRLDKIIGYLTELFNLLYEKEGIGFYRRFESKDVREIIGKEKDVTERIRKEKSDEFKELVEEEVRRNIEIVFGVRSPDFDGDVLREIAQISSSPRDPSKPKREECICEFTFSDNVVDPKNPDVYGIRKDFNIRGTHLEGGRFSIINTEYLRGMSDEELGKLEEYLRRTLLLAKIVYGENI